MSARDLIVAWVVRHGDTPNWLLRLFLHLVASGVPSDAAIEAMECFVDEAIAIKMRKSLPV